MISSHMKNIITEKIKESIYDSISRFEDYEVDFNREFHLVCDQLELTEEEKEEIYSEVKNYVDIDEIIGDLQEASEYHKNPLEYLGMSEKDFF